MNNGRDKFINIRTVLQDRVLQFFSTGYQEPNTAKLFSLSLREIDLETVVISLAFCGKQVSAC